MFNVYSWFRLHFLWRKKKIPFLSMVGNWEKHSPECLETPPVTNSVRLQAISLLLLIGIMRGLNEKNLQSPFRL